METIFFNITLPTSWADLTDSQLRFLYAQLRHERPSYDIKTRCALHWV
jgi:hypothetical protein